MFGGVAMGWMRKWGGRLGAGREARVCSKALEVWCQEGQAGGPGEGDGCQACMTEAHPQPPESAAP